MALKTLAIRAHRKGLELAYHIPAAVPDALLGDPGRLRQIVVNLVGNAIKFTEQGEVVMRVTVEWHIEDEVCSPLYCDRHGHWHSTRQAAAHFHPLHASRQFHDTPLWRHRIRFGDFVTTGGHDGWPHLG